MSFAEFWNALTPGAYTADTETAIVGGAIRYGLANNISGSEILRGLQGIGLGVRRQTFYQLVNAERARQASGILPVDVNLTVAPGVDQIRQVAQGRPGTYLTNLRLTYRVAGEGGAYHLEERNLSVSSRTPISPAQAMQVAADIWAEHSANYPNLSIYDIEYLGTIQHTGRAA